MSLKQLFFGLFAALAFSACQKKGTEKAPTEPPVFRFIDAKTSGLNFRNDLKYDAAFNIYTYRNFYNGGGVAIGDIDRDGLPDVFFTSNMGQNKLYRNLGGLKFEDITEKAGVGGKGSWCTGVAMADVNGDGWLDLYVCNSGLPTVDQRSEAALFSRENELFLNNQNGTFSEKAREVGLADRGLTTHAAFFDYDRDGDLDCYVLNNSFAPIGSFNLRNNLRNTRDSLGGHKLYKNDNGHFTDVSEKAGILGSIIAFGLGVTVGDVNEDGWDDIYVSNDFFERDYLYINQKNGTFSEELEKSMRHISAASMGADMADIDGDARPDIFVTDMLPEPDYRIKKNVTFEDWNRFQYAKRCGYWNQFSQNMLHLNNGDGTFSEVARLAGVAATDWSWGALIFDFQNDGRKDLFVANGIAQDLTDLDYVNFIADPRTRAEITASKKVDFKRLIDSIPSEAQPNYYYLNDEKLSFKDKTAAWGLKKPSFSNGSAYGDLDNDGDLDLVISNVNDVAFLMENQTNEKANYLQFELEGEGKNTFAFGTKITARAAGRTFFIEQMPVRGFQSSVDPRPILGFEKLEKVDTLLVEWPSGKITFLQNVPTRQTLELAEKDGQKKAFEKSWFKKPKPLFADVTASQSMRYVHRENGFVDWDRDKLMYFMRSVEGPRMAFSNEKKGGSDDLFFICGAANQAGQLFRISDFGFRNVPQPDFEKDKMHEDVDACFFDADGDGDQDLYVCSGGNEFEPNAPELADRLYLNNGKGHFSRKINALPPTKPFASSCVRPNDFDGDGDQDLFVGMRMMPKNYGLAVSSFLLENDGRGNFRPSPQAVLKDLGMVTDAVWQDLDGDKKAELLIVGEWTAPRVFRVEKGQLLDASDRFLSKKAAEMSGFWNRIVSTGDLNGDGKTDFALGNHGWNSRLKTYDGQPVSLFFNDFDRNGTSEQVLTRFNSGRQLPLVLRHDLVGSVPILKKKYLAFRNYVGQGIEDIFTEKQREGMATFEARELGSSILLSQKDGKFLLQNLPVEAQFAPIYGIAASDFDGDGKIDLLTGGNFTKCRPEMGSLDADFGLFLKGDGQGGFRAVRSAASGFRVDGEVRDMLVLGAKILVARNDASMLVFEKK